MVIPPVEPHWLDERTKISEVDEHGNVVQISYGQSKREQLADHKRGRCGALCSFCYAEAGAMQTWYESDEPNHI